jgi:hypothetical protein
VRIVDLEEAERDQAAESSGEDSRTEEYWDTEAQLSTGVEESEGKHHSGEESSFTSSASKFQYDSYALLPQPTKVIYGLPKKKTKHKKASEVFGSALKHSNASPDHHQSWKSPLRWNLFGEYVEWRIERSEWNVEEQDEQRVLIAFEMQVFVDAVSLSIANICTVDGIEEVHDG